MENELQENNHENGMEQAEKDVNWEDDLIELKAEREMAQ